jgi:hypothetical protein
VRVALVSVAAVLATSLAVAGCGGGAAARFAGASIVPSSVAAFVSIDSDPDSSQWQDADELAQRFPEREQAITELEESLSDEGLDFEQDIEPALGPEVDIVWLDFDGNGEHFVALMQPGDEDAFRRLVAKGNAQDPSDQLVYEQVEGWYVMSDKQANIDAFKSAVAAGGPALADHEPFRQSMDAYSSGAIVSAYVSGATVMEELRTSLASDETDFLDKVGTLDWLSLSLATTPEGVRFDTTVRGTPGSLLRSAGEASPDFELTLPEELPGDVLLYLAFHGAGDSLSELQDNPVLDSSEFDELKSILDEVGVLLDGEGAFYVRPSDGDIPEITLVTEPREGTDGVATLDRILRDADLGDALERTQIAGADATRLSLADELEVDYANVGDKLVVTTEPAGIEAIANPGETLAEASSYREAVDAADKPSNVAGFFYVDIRGGMDLAERLSGAPIPDSVKRNVKPLRSAVEYAVSRPSEVQVTFFLRIDEAGS